MKLTRSLTALALTAVALTGTLGAQNRGGGRSDPRGAAPGAGGGARSAPRSAAPAARGGQADNRARPNTPPAQHNTAARPETRGRTDYQNYNNVRDNRNNVRDNRNDFRDNRGGNQNRADVRGYQDNRARVDVRGREGYRGPVDRGRPLISRIGNRGVNYGGRYYNNGYRYYRGINRFGVNIVLPFGWERPLFVRGYFPARYADYCEAVPVDLEYMLPEMRDGYDPCLIGDRVVVYDRYSRGSIVFSAIIP